MIVETIFETPLMASMVCILLALLQIKINWAGLEEEVQLLIIGLFAVSYKLIKSEFL